MVDFFGLRLGGVPRKQKVSAFQEKKQKAKKEDGELRVIRSTVELPRSADLFYKKLEPQGLKEGQEWTIHGSTLPATWIGV